MSSFLRKSIDAQLGALIAKIDTADEPGNLDGMFARYVMMVSGVPSREWKLDEDALGWTECLNESHYSFSSIAALGYQLFSDQAPGLHVIFLDGLARLRVKDPYPGDHFALAFHPIAFLGVCLGVMACDSKDNVLWLSKLLRERPSYEPPTFFGIIEQWSRALLTRTHTTVHEVSATASLPDIAALIVGCRNGSLSFSDAVSVANVQNGLLMSMTTSSMEDLGAREAAVLWTAASYVLASAISELALTRRDVSRVLQSFPDAMRRWRWDGDDVKKPIHWQVGAEREIQDILWIMLRPIFSDLIDEEVLSKTGTASSRPDFAVPSLKLLIEVKYCRKAADLRRFEGEIAIDAFQYLKSPWQGYEEIIVFIYDESCSVQEHDRTRKAMLLVDGVGDVVVVSRPSQLPAP